MRKFIFGTTFLLLAPFCLIFLLIAVLFVYQLPKTASDPSAMTAFGSPVAFAALPTEQNIQSASITQGDGRAKRIHDFLASYGSPLTPYADLIVSDADKYGLDYRLLVSIAMQESGLCRHEIDNSHNCYGFGIYGNHVTYFSTYAEGIDTVSKALAEKYKADGLITPQQISGRWTPASHGSWTQGVNYFMDELQ